jgi:hypothetical protein
MGWVQNPQPCQGALIAAQPLSKLFLPIDIIPMSNLMNHNYIFGLKDLINNAEVSDTELVQTRKVPYIHFWPDVIQVRGDPFDTRNNSPGNRFI